MINSEVDYIIKKASLIEWQKLLNQWIHTYRSIEIVESKIHENGEVTIILKRIK